MNVRKILFGFLILILIFPAQAQNLAGNTLLWEVRKPGNAAPSYIFGTIHLICPADFFLSDSAKSALGKTDQLALEIDMDDPALPASMMSGMMMKNNGDLKDLITAEEYARLERYYKDSVGMSIEFLRKVKPFAMAAQLFSKVLSCEPKSYEMSLMELAAGAKKEIIGIETIDEQMAIFDSIPYKDQAKMVLHLIDNMPKARTELIDLIKLYKSQNVGALYNLSKESEFGMEGDEGILLVERNRKWIPRLQKVFSEKPTFVAVGAAHLGGETGVLKLLQKEGYVIRPVGN